MLIDGEKYACEACVRGHRVSNCQHADRPLSHINKKGRPVSQCAHCRTFRKSRSAHVKCDCGEKSHAKGTCTHLKDGDKAESCACCHGGRCTCALKKEHLDPVLESDSDEAAHVHVDKPRRPHAKTAQSDLALTIFTNGHHKPPQKHNQMAHKRGLPYVVPRAHSIHGPSPSGLANRSVDNLPHTSTIDALHSESHIKDSMISAQQEQRLIRSEHGSPYLAPSSVEDASHVQRPALDVLGEFSTEYRYMPLETFAPNDNEPCTFSSALSLTPVDWSHYDFSNENYDTSSYSQAQSFTGFDFGSIDQPARTTTSTSGEISEVEDFGSTADSGARPILKKQFGSEASDFGDHDGYRLGTTSSYVVGLQAPPHSNNNMESLTMEEFLLKSCGNKYAPAVDDFVSDDIPVCPKYTQDATATMPSGLSSFQLPMADDVGSPWMIDFTTGGNSNQAGLSDTTHANAWMQ